MAATITYSAPRVTISGAYKGFLSDAGSTTTVINYASGEAPASGDAGRFLLWCRGGTSDTAQWEVRRIVSATTTTVTVHDPFGATPAAGQTFRISSTISDVLADQPSSGTATGTSTFAMNCDMELASAAFFASADTTIEWTRTHVTITFPMASNCVLQLGVLWGGEANNSRITTNGCRWSMVHTGTGDSSVFTSGNEFSSSGPIFNIYGSLIDSRKTSGYFFHRMVGPARFIGSIFDGIAGGRFYSSRSEWVDCRMSGNVQSTPAWSIGATFTRAVENVFFFKNDFAFKNYQNYGGTLRNTTFSQNGISMNRDATSSGSVINFIDCTELASGDFTGNGGQIFQYRSVNYTMTDAGGTPISGAMVRINNNVDTTQGTISASDSSGVVAEKLALRFYQSHSSTTLNAYAPFRIRIRKYGKLWGALSTSIASPINQSYALNDNMLVTEDSSTASTHTGITLVDHGGSPVSWESKNWGITVTGDLSVNPSLTSDNIFHYLQYHLAQNNTIGGKSSGLLWHNLCPLPTETERNSYGATQKGVRIVDENEDAFPGFERFQSDDGSYYTVPVFNVGSVTNAVSGSRLQVYNLTTDTELYNDIIGETYTLNYIEASTITIGDEIRVRLAGPAGASAYYGYQSVAVANSNGWSVNADQLTSDIYDSNGIDGTTITEFSGDYPNIQIDINDPDGVTSVKRIYAWFLANQHTEDGIANFFGGIVADDTVNYKVITSILDLQLDNVSGSPLLVIDGRLYRDDGTTVIYVNSDSIQMDPSRVYSITSSIDSTTLNKIKLNTDLIPGLF